jgi:hypothetical protein
MVNINGFPFSRSSSTWCAVLGAVLATVPADPRLDRPVQMAAQHALHLGMAAHDLDELTAAGETVAVHVLDPRLERRMMHEDDGRAIGRLGQARREPAQTLLAEEPAGLAGNERVERDEPDRENPRRRTG